MATVTLTIKGTRILANGDYKVYYASRSSWSNEYTYELRVLYDRHTYEHTTIPELLTVVLNDNN